MCHIFEDQYNLLGNIIYASRKHIIWGWGVGGIFKFLGPFSFQVGLCTLNQIHQKNLAEGQTAF